MRIFHYNDEEKRLHQYLAERGHKNLVVSDKQVPFPIVRSERFDAAFIGLHPYGLGLMHQLRKINPDCLVIIITADQDIRRAIQAMHDGAIDYLLTPLSMDDIRRCYCRMLRDHELRRELRNRPPTNVQNHDHQLIGDSPYTHWARSLIGRMATNPHPLLITGPSGSGRTYLSELIASAGGRIVNRVDGSVADDQTLMNTLHQTDAIDLDAPVSHAVTIEHIESLAPATQDQLANWLSKRQEKPNSVNGHSPSVASPRIVGISDLDQTSTHGDGGLNSSLRELMTAIPIEVPPLTKRTDDIVPLAEHFIADSTGSIGCSPPTIEAEVWERLLEHDWPANVRELKSLCTRASIIANGETITQDIIELAMRFSGTVRNQEIHQPISTAEPASLADSKATLEKTAIDQALRANQGNVSAAARELKISRTTLYKKCRRYQIKLSGPYADIA